MNMYRQNFLFLFFIDLLFSFNIIIKVDEYVKPIYIYIYIYIYIIFSKKVKLKNNKKKNNNVTDEVAQQECSNNKCYIYIYIYIYKRGTLNNIK